MGFGNVTAIPAYQHSTFKPRMVARIMDGGVGRPGSLNLILADNELISLHMPKNAAQTLRLLPLG